MFQIDLPWKPFIVNTNAVEAWVKTQGTESYVGCSADHDLTLWFSSPPDEDTKNAIMDYWDDLTETSHEATSFVPLDTYRSAVSTLKSGIPGKKWDDLSKAEQMLIMGQPPTHEDLGLSGSPAQA